MKLNKRFLSLVAAVAITMLFTVPAMAQNPGYSMTGTETVPIQWIGVFNASDSVIVDGTVVMTDTTTATTSNIKRFAVRPWDGGALNRHRILGLAMGNIERRGATAAAHKNAPGVVLVTGFHARARMGAAALAANTPLRTMAGVNGSLTAATDTLLLRVGTFIGYNSDATTFPNRTGKVLITRQMSIHATVLP